MRKLFKNEVFRTIVSYAFIILIVVLIRLFIFDPVRVEGHSMDTTLSDGEIMILNKVYYRKNDIERFDIVVVDEGDKNIIKRVIGLPGEVISYRNNKLYIDGQEVSDPFPSKKTEDFTLGDIGHERIPGGCYFVMGDNRNHSADARGWINKYVKKSKIVAKAEFKYWPWGHKGLLKRADYAE